MIAILTGGYQLAGAADYAAPAVKTIHVAMTATVDAYDLGAQHAEPRVSPARHGGAAVGRGHTGTARSSLSAADVVAAEGAGTVAVNGETAATALGRAMHKSWDYGPGFTKEFSLRAGGRVDAINFGTREVIELKPNNLRAIRLGERQLEDYIAKLNAQFPGDPWTGRIVTYGSP